jgi:hypothetical protein
LLFCGLPEFFAVCGDTEMAHVLAHEKAHEGALNGA